jgi:hypothetical protein
MAARDDTPAAQLPPTAHAAELAPTPLPAHPGPKGKRKGAKGRAKAPKDGDELIGARVFMPGRCEGARERGPARGGGEAHAKPWEEITGVLCINEAPGTCACMHASTHSAPRTCG